MAEFAVSCSPHQETLSSASCRPPPQDVSRPGFWETPPQSACGCLPLVTVTSVLLQAILCKSPALIWAGLSPRPGVLPLSGGLSLLWLHVSCFPIFPCAVRESAVRPAASPSFPVPGEVFLTGVSMPVLKGVLFLPQGVFIPSSLLGHFSPSSPSSVSL